MTLQGSPSIDMLTANMDGSRILVVDDDADIRILLSDFLEQHGFAVTAVADGVAMDQALAAQTFDIAVLDVMMPGEDGLSILRRLAASGDLPIIMLSAIGGDIDRIVGLEMGAEDYLPKPCNPRELLARVRTVLRRNRRQTSEPQVPAGQRLRFAGWQVDMGVRLLTDARDNVWFDAGMKAVQEKIDQQLPNTINLITPARNPQAAHMLVESYSAVQPPVFWLADIRTGKLNKVGESHAAIKPAEMGGQQFVRYKARDGREIPALLTLPAGASPKNLPLVMLVHGGPFVRGTEMGWKAQAQFLASRGYAVLEPEYRGSTGFGNAHFRAGWKQWGLGMQDDIADGARWAARQGYADPDRICIAGGSYGGYAALMGVVKDPGLYRCAVDWMGVTDIN
ncbi:response regulator, partial [Sphingobium yanoikuyae]|uniref:response regulator n=1 Tax=Sphingobium yanoikuyae TaxID=13690 RepID=UPI0026EB5414